MDGWFKGLVGTACVVVIAAGAYFAWSEYKSAQAQAALERAQAARAAETANAAAETARTEKLTSGYCNSLATSVLSKVSGMESRTPERLDDLKECARLDRFGYVERRDLVAAKLL